ncbi:hypothetical protein [Candidatus Marimicrobium litorale]|uniref:Uncharacterized protein n=1 Tax=Candidatus Marimicrobium litorale TaxID=2518991 RepID=A0ABT3T7M3_9GAMM|nr:hypothetical protein [Candidatus Marimicrobium litorale]MCX2977489.1 hypothetical protein [Candidatus Marimicrobium litorale]
MSATGLLNACLACLSYRGGRLPIGPDGVSLHLPHPLWGSDSGLIRCHAQHVVAIASATTQRSASESEGLNVASALVEHPDSP